MKEVFKNDMKEVFIFIKNRFGWIDIFRWFFTGIVIIQLHLEYGWWLTMFALLVTIALELNILSNRIVDEQLRVIDQILGSIVSLLDGSAPVDTDKKND